ncbi:hypothetical protein LZ31DRAFT_597598 [Colletotrichum somersetense]|nr:hypothetical protein LZ31DRAFT_597598 [Colletotrichum somersetense]
MLLDISWYCENPTWKPIDISYGFYKVWFDGAKVLERYDIPTTVDDDSAFQFRAFRQVWSDEIAVGSTFKDVDPAQ